MKENICRPITFYNTFMPISKNKLVCRYYAFGTVDGIDVGDNILDASAKSITEKIWEAQKKFCLTLNGSYTAERVYAVIYDEKDEEEAFWEEGEYPFFFFCRIQCKNDKVKAWENRSSIEQLLPRLAKVKTKLYLTFDNSDFLLVMRANDYETGAGLIDRMHFGNAEINRFCVLKNSYTIFAVKHEWLKTLTNQELRKYNEKKIYSVNIRVIQETAGTISKTEKELKEKLSLCGFDSKPENFKCIPALGADDY